jgi:hypothetical protein
MEGGVLGMVSLFFLSCPSPPPSLTLLDAFFIPPVIPILEMTVRNQA